ncbi:hypothetical protein [uncultured Abiotrophia sp.]|uniref:hypothetical protein n=1 Tax=uncultured Abiotrophia sp. TaxID=316094 RepID=UPI0028F04D8A|nr:hypothetical protein [uncultured Abiotrophia sp.]
MEKNKKSENYSLFDELKKWSPIFFGIVLAAIILSVLMVAIAKLIPGANLFLMDKDGYYNVTLIGTLIAGMALVINTIESERKAKEERERHNRAIRLQIEKERIDRLYIKFYEYYKTVYELVEGYDEMIVSLQGLDRLDELDGNHIDTLLVKEEYTKRFNEALCRVDPTYKSRIWIAGAELCCQIPDESNGSKDPGVELSSQKSDESESGKSPRAELEASIDVIAKGIQGYEIYDITESRELLNSRKESIGTFMNHKIEIIELLQITTDNFKLYVADIQKELIK